MTPSSSSHAADPADFHALVQAAALAPSSHNTQPWLFRRAGDGVELFADRTRALPVNDPEDRELTISCGCALFNLRVAAAAAGLGAELALLPDACDPDLLARVRLHAHAAQAEPPEAELEPAITQRRTYRERFAPTAPDDAAVRRLVAAAQLEGAMLTVLASDEQRHAAAALVAEGDAWLWANPSWRRELAAWMHPRRRGDGLTLPALSIPIAQLVVRSFDMGQGVAAKDRQLADESPVLAVLATEGDQPHDWLRAGQALQRLLLVGVQHGLQASYLNQAIQVPTLRPRLQQLSGRPECVQLLLRIGKPLHEVAAPPRRAWADLVVTA